jgi:pyruvate dehydrogenase E2 component (dihydrolipoamide acetyltransferase)
VRATPVARRVAKELGVNLEQVRGSGPNGIIRDEDVRAFSQQSTRSANAQLPPSEAAPSEAAPSQASPAASTEDEWLEPTAIQAITGQRMLHSAQTAPQFSMTSEADMTNLLWLQEALAGRIAAETGQKLTLTALLVKVIAAALKNHPLANASFENGKIHVHRQINLGVAVGTDHGLVVPVIRSADGCTLAEVARQVSAFQENARTMRFSPGDLEGGTFSLSNLGMYGVVQFNAILNPPQSAILAVGKIVRRPVELPGGTIGLRPLMNLTLTVDHRVMDGLQGARCLAEIKERLETPYFIL